MYTIYDTLKISPLKKNKFQRLLIVECAIQFQMCYTISVDLNERRVRVFSPSDRRIRLFWILVSGVQEQQV